MLPGQNAHFYCSASSHFYSIYKKIWVKARSSGLNAHISWPLHLHLQHYKHNSLGYNVYNMAAQQSGLTLTVTPEEAKQSRLTFTLQHLVKFCHILFVGLATLLIFRFQHFGLVFSTLMFRFWDLILLWSLRMMK